METTPFDWAVLGGSFALYQTLLSLWALRKTGSWSVASATLLLPAVGLVLAISRIKEDLKDNQVGGATTYVTVVLGILVLWTAYNLQWDLPAVDIPWFVIYAMIFFAGLGVLNVLDVAVEMRPKGNGREPR